MAKLLLVEDDNNLREIYEARLKAEGYETSTAKDGEEALVVAKQQQPDLIISDVMMPKISGFEILDILRNTPGLEHVKVIMLTALGQAEDRSRADALGADKYLVKSQVTLEDIVKTAKELLDQPAAGSADPSTPAPASDALAAPTTSPAPATTAAAATASSQPSDASPATALPGSVANEEATVQQQIDQFVATVPADPPASSEPAQSDTPASQTSSADEPSASMPMVAEPADQPTPDPDPTSQTPASDAAADQADATDSNDRLIAQATEALQSTADEPAPAAPVTAIPVSTPEEAEPEPPTASSITTPEEVHKPALQNAADNGADTPADNDGVTISGKKIILPPADTGKPDINELLAREEAKESGLSTPPSNPISISEDGALTADAPAGGTISPQTAPATMVTEPTKNDDFDPNSVAL
jgi:CheY-like chemotaxis protein